MTALRRTATGWQVAANTTDRATLDDFTAVVCALPAEALATLELDGVADAGRLHVLREIVQPPVASVFAGFRREDVRHPLDGFGVLVPQVERLRTLGTLFSSTLFPGRAPAGHVALTTFLGGMRAPELVGLDDREILRVVRDDLTRLLGITAPPVFTHVQRWTRAIPQYELGYSRFKAAIASLEAVAPGFFIGGNCRDGISLSNCIEAGRRLADAVLTVPVKDKAAVAKRW